MKIDNPAFDYNTHGQHYSTIRMADPHIAAYVNKALEGAKTVINVGS
jgi:hypothetical protein